MFHDLPPSPALGKDRRQQRQREPRARQVSLLGHEPAEMEHLELAVSHEGFVAALTAQEHLETGGPGGLEDHVLGNDAAAEKRTGLGTEVFYVGLGRSHRCSARRKSRRCRPSGRVGRPRGLPSRRPRGWPNVNPCSLSWGYSAASAATVEESSPPLSDTATGTSARSRIRTASFSSSADVLRRALASASWPASRPRPRPARLQVVVRA